MSFEKQPLQTEYYGSAASSYIYSQCSNVFLVIARNVNGNVMVYEAILDNKRNLEKIDIYWLDIDPKYRANSRKSGKNNDKLRISKLDEFGYGVEIIRKLNTQKWEIKFKQFPEKMIVRVHANNVALYRKDSKGKIQKVHHLLLHARVLLNVLPTVEKIDIVAYDIQSKTKVQETIKT